MYPFLRLIASTAAARRMSPLDPLDTHISQHRVRLADCDIFGEMNNGRILTLYEFGRFQLSQRVGLWKLLRTKGWGFTVAGSSIRYRARLTPLERYEMRTRLVHWDGRFVHLEQGMFKHDGRCANHLLIRTAVVSKGKAVPTAEVMEALDFDQASPQAPKWVKAWMEAEQQRPWPPEM
ncbi:MAG: acyl-CoA thioesterase [Pseudomonadota bacterium]